MADVDIVRKLENNGMGATGTFTHLAVLTFSHLVILNQLLLSCPVQT